MRSFLLWAVEHLGTFAEGNVEVPVRIIRAMNDVERIAQIDDSALPLADPQLPASNCPAGFRHPIWHLPLSSSPGHPMIILRSSSVLSSLILRLSSGPHATSPKRCVGDLP
jgi:hypothetical protein